MLSVLFLTSKKSRIFDQNWKKLNSGWALSISKSQKSQNRDSRKLIKYTCFRKSRKMAILRGSKLENYWSDWNEILTDKNIRRDLFNREIRPKKYWIAAELWASQNRDFSKISKTRVFHQLSRIFENMAEIGIFPYKNPKREGKSRFPPYFGPKSNFLGQHTPKVRNFL